MDIGKASDFVSKVLSRYNLKNLDELFTAGEMTTTEFMAKKIQQDLAELIQKDFNEVCGDGICKDTWKGQIRVTLWESHKAWASYEDTVA